MIFTVGSGCQSRQRRPGPRQQRNSLGGTPGSIPDRDSALPGVPAWLTAGKAVQVWAGTCLDADEAWRDPRSQARMESGLRGREELAVPWDRLETPLGEA